MKRRPGRGKTLKAGGTGGKALVMRSSQKQRRKQEVGVNVNQRACGQLSEEEKWYVVDEVMHRRTDTSYQRCPCIWSQWVKLSEQKMIRLDFFTPFVKIGSTPLKSLPTTQSPSILCFDRFIKQEVAGRLRILFLQISFIIPVSLCVWDAEQRVDRSVCVRMNLPTKHYECWGDWSQARKQATLNTQHTHTHTDEKPRVSTDLKMLIWLTEWRKLRWHEGKKEGKREKNSEQTPECSIFDSRCKQ